MGALDAGARTTYRCITFGGTNENTQSVSVLRTRKTFAASLVAGSLLLVSGFAVSTKFAPDARARTTGATLSGAVTSPSGAAIPGAHLVLYNTGTGADHPFDSNGSGEYTLNALPPGGYTLTVTRDGFQTYKQQGIVLTASEQAAATWCFRWARPRTP